MDGSSDYLDLKATHLADKANFKLLPNPKIFVWEKSLKVIPGTATEFKTPGERLNSGITSYHQSYLLGSS